VKPRPKIQDAFTVRASNVSKLAASGCINEVIKTDPADHNRMSTVAGCMGWSGSFVPTGEKTAFKQAVASFSPFDSLGLELTESTRTTRGTISKAERPHMVQPKARDKTDFLRQSKLKDKIMRDKFVMVRDKESKASYKRRSLALDHHDQTFAKLQRYAERKQQNRAALIQKLKIRMDQLGSAQALFDDFDRGRCYYSCCAILLLLSPPSLSQTQVGTSRCPSCAWRSIE
jgi:hypothetical protein